MDAGDHGAPAAAETEQAWVPVSSLPPPPPPPPQLESDAWPATLKFPGQLSPVWRLTFGLGWAFVVACNAAVWETSRIIGLSTWWLGAEAQPHFVLIQLLPFYAPIIATIAAISNWRNAPYVGLAAGAVGMAIAAGDLGRVRWIAVVELVIAAAGLCISGASIVGMYRAVTPETAAQPTA
jgi:hypothetical protein